MGRAALAAAFVLALICGCSGTTPQAEADPTGPAAPAAPSSAADTQAAEVRPLDGKALDRRLRRYLAGRASGAGIMVVDRATGRSYGFRERQSFVTASVAKLDILMTLLLRRQRSGRRLTDDERYDAAIMIKESDNKAADRNFVRSGGATGVNTANRRSFGLRNTTAIDAICQDLLCWSLTSTTPDDQVRLLRRLFTGPLSEANRGYVLELMGKVEKDQRWGMSAGALDGDKVYNKNGWMTHERDGDRWAINSVGRVEGHGHDLLIAVMTNHNPSMGYGITTAEHLVRAVAEAFRATTPPS